MPHYHKIQPLAFQLRDAGQPLRATMQTLVFPEPWKTAIHQLQAMQSRRPPAESRIKISTLNKALRALVPDLISITPNADKAGAERWLIAQQPIDTQIIHRIVTAWIRGEYANADSHARRNVLTSLKAADLQWREQTFDLSSWTVTANGTATTTHTEHFILLPDLLAAQLSRTDISFELEHERLQFRRAPLRPGGQGAELISWPPRRSVKHKQEWYYSVVITLTVQTTPFQPSPVIHCDIGLRRWMSQPVKRLPLGEETSVFLLTRVPWIDGLPLSTSFQVAPIRIERSAEPDQADTFVWGSNLAPILNELVPPDRSFPQPADICAHPVKALNLSGDWHAALVYRNGMWPEHAVDPGVMTKNRRTLFEQIAAHFQPFVTVVEPLPKCYPARNIRIDISQSVFDKRMDNAEAFPKRRAAIAQTTGNELALEIYFQTDSVRDALIRAIERLLGITIDSSFPTTITTPELRITVDVRQLGSLGAPLAIPSTSGKFHDRLYKAMRARWSEIANQIASTTRPIAALIELQGKDDFRGSEDPKHALRIGFALQNRLTQFVIAGADERLEHRARNSVLDLFRQLGVGFRLPQPQSLGLHQLGVAGFWMINRQRASSPSRTQQALPVCVYIDLVTQQIKAFAPGLAKWLPYPQALLEVARVAANGKLSEFQRPHTAINVADSILLELRSAGNTLLLVHAQNARRAWPWLANNRITIDQLAFNEESPQPIKHWPGLRVIRIRDRQGHETPEWYARHETATGYMKGLSQINERVFASTYGKPPQFRQARHEGNLDELAWNPAIVEITVAALQPGDTPLAWAAYTHELRQALIHYDEATVLPLPLHLAELMAEYAIAFAPLHESDDEAG